MRRSSLDPRTEGGLSGREKTRLLVLFLVGGGLSAFVLSLFSGRPPEPGPEVDRPWEAIEKIELSISVKPWRPPVAEVERLVHEESAELRVQEYPRGLNLLATAAREHLPEWILNDPELKAEGGFARVPPAELADPHRAPQRRGKPVEVVGLVLDDVIVDDPARDLGLDPEVFKFKVHTGVIDCDGQPVAFVMARELDNRLAREDRVKLRGVFFRVKEAPRSWEEDPVRRAEYVTMPIIVGMDLLPAVPLVLRDSLPLDFARKLRGLDDLDVQVAPQEDPKFYTLLGYVLAKGKDVFEGREPAPIRGHDTLERPDDFVLEPVQARGTLAYIGWESFDYRGMRAGDAPLLGYWHLVVVPAELDKNPLVQVVYPHEKRPEGLRKGAEVAIDGIFFRLHAYTGGGRGEKVRTPMMIATGEPRIIEIPADERPNDLVLAFIGVGGALAAGLVVMLLRDRRRSRSFEEKLRERRTSRHKSWNLDLNRVAESVRQDPE